MPRLRHAFKEWADVCTSLASGHQSIILRKGGIAESSGIFTVDHPEFWLFPTFVHQREQPGALKPEFRLARSEPSPIGSSHRLTHFACVSKVAYCSRLDQLLEIDSLHVWSEKTIHRRFEYRTPGLFVMATRIFRADRVREIPDSPEVEGCRTWVDLGDETEAYGEPVLTNSGFREIERRLEVVFGSELRTLE